MLTVTSCPLELRGVAHKTSKKGKIYYVINCEDKDGTPYGFYCPDAKALSPSLKKGDSVLVSFEVTYFKGNEKLSVTYVEKVEE